MVVWFVTATLLPFLSKVNTAMATQSTYKSCRELFEDAKTRKELGNQCFKSGDSKKAKKHYLYALMITRSISSRDTVGRSMAFFSGSIQSGLVYDEPQSFKEDVEYLESNCQKNLSLIFVNEKNWDKSLEYSKLALERNENDPKSLYRHSFSALNLGLLDAAESCCNKLLELEPDNKLYLKLLRDIQNQNAANKNKEKKMYSRMFQ